MRFSIPTDLLSRSSRNSLLAWRKIDSFSGVQPPILTNFVRNVTRNRSLALWNTRTVLKWANFHCKLFEASHVFRRPVIHRLGLKQDPPQIKSLKKSLALIILDDEAKQWDEVVIQWCQIDALKESSTETNRFVRNVLLRLPSPNWFLPSTSTYNYQFNFLAIKQTINTLLDAISSVNSRINLLMSNWVEYRENVSNFFALDIPSSSFKGRVIQDRERIK